MENNANKDTAPKAEETKTTEKAAEPTVVVTTAAAPASPWYASEFSKGVYAGIGGTLIIGALVWGACALLSGGDTIAE